MTSIEELIQQELSTIDMTNLHASIPTLPKKSHTIETFEKIQKQQQQQLDEFTIGGIDMERYDLENDFSDDTLAIVAMYAILKDASLSVSKEVNGELWDSQIQDMRYLISQIERDVDRTNEEVDVIGNKRRKLTQESEVTIEYLEQRRLDALRKIIEIKVESIKLAILKSKR